MPKYCPEHLFPFIKRCWSEDPAERPSFKEIKEHMYRDPIFPRSYKPQDINENSLDVPTKYEVMRRNYALIQRSNPSYLSMDGRSHSSSRHTIESEENRLSKPIAALPLSTYEGDSTSCKNETKQTIFVNEDSKSSASDFLRFLSEDNKAINV